MSLITQCPACATMFKVVPDQLRISDGWVRCGQCDEVFDANANLQSAFETVPVAAPIESPGELEWGGMLEAEAKASEPSLSLDFPAPEQAESSIAAHTADLDPIPSAFAFDSRARASEDLASAEPEAAVDIDPLDATVVAQAPKEVDTPEFLKAAPSPASKGGRLWRFVWVSLSALLVGTLLVQVVIQERDRIVATAPSMAEWLQPVCHMLGCKISPLQQIESILIDQSSFGKAQSDGYVLGFAVKSTALTDVATPSLELTLTDMQDRAVVRRVFSPGELGYQSEVLSPGREWSGSVPVDVKLTEGSERISGYRLLAFYP